MISERIDKWLWSVRIFKTRSMATEACKKGRIKINGVETKPSKEAKVNDRVEVRKPPVNFTFIVKGFPKNRIGAKLVNEFLENITPESELEKLNAKLFVFQSYRNPGTGRPTKKERRSLDEIRDLGFEDWDNSWDEEI